MKVKVTKDGLLIPKEVTDRLGSDEVEIFEEPGRVLISPAVASPEALPKASSGQVGDKPDGQKDPILSMGEDPVDDGIADASENHDRYLYTGD